MTAGDLRFLPHQYERIRAAEIRSNAIAASGLRYGNPTVIAPATRLNRLSASVTNAQKPVTDTK